MDNSRAYTYNQTLVFKSDKASFCIPADDILFIEQDDEGICIIHLVCNEEIVLHSSLSKVMNNIRYQMIELTCRFKHIRGNCVINDKFSCYVCPKENRVWIRDPETREIHTLEGDVEHLKKLKEDIDKTVVYNGTESDPNDFDLDDIINSIKDVKEWTFFS